ncbi:MULTISPECIES: acyl-CoA dehydrogenase family protein [unclassified Pseudomonas]|nr:MULTISPECIES: acyl-CoA dehydrogenase family protein [unclassified Pseudomonas]
MGLLGGELTEKYGGSGLDCVTAGIIIERSRAVILTRVTCRCCLR